MYIIVSIAFDFVIVLQGFKSPRKKALVLLPFMRACILVSKAVFDLIHTVLFTACCATSYTSSTEELYCFPFIALQWYNSTLMNEPSGLKVRKSAISPGP